MGNQQAKTWFTGFFDGEGSFMITLQKTSKKSYYMPRITIAGTCFKTRDYIKELYTTEGVPFNEEFRKGTDKVRDSWSLRTQGIKRCKSWLTVFPPPVFFTKSVEARILLQFIDSRLSSTDHKRPYTETEETCRNLLSGRRMPHRLHAERQLLTMV
jgi:hypothetical protein